MYISQELPGDWTHTVLDLCLWWHPVSFTAKNTIIDKRVLQYPVFCEICKEYSSIVLVCAL
jgi:hypothetical protein